MSSVVARRLGVVSFPVSPLSFLAFGPTLGVAFFILYFFVCFVCRSLFRPLVLIEIFQTYNQGLRGTFSLYLFPDNLGQFDG